MPIQWGEDIPRERDQIHSFVSLVFTVRKAMASLSTSLQIKHNLSFYGLNSSSLTRSRRRSSSIRFTTFRRGCATAFANFDNDNREYVIVGGGNAAGYAARTFAEHGLADGRLCIVTKEAYAPYERPALTKAYLFPPEKKPARLPGFHTCVGSGGERQTPEWYKEKGIEMIYEDPVASINIEKQTLTTNSGKLLKYGSLLIATGCTASRFPEKIGGNLPGVHYIRDIADADSLISYLMTSMDWYLGNEINDFVVPNDKDLEDEFTSQENWSKWGVSAFGNMESPN